METINVTRSPPVAAGAASSSSFDRFSSSPHQQHHHHHHPLARKVERILSRPLDLTYLPDALSSLSSVFGSSPVGDHPAAPNASSFSSHSTPGDLHNTSSSFPFDENSQNSERTDTRTASSSFHGTSQSLLSFSSPVALASTPAALSALLYRERLRIHAECLSAFSPVRSKVHTLSSRVQSLRTTFGEVSVHLRHSQHQLKPLLRQVSQLRSAYEHLQERQKLCQLLLDKLQLSPHHLKSLTATYPISTDGRSEGEGASSSSASLQVTTDATHDQGNGLSSGNNLPSSRTPQPHQQSSSPSSSSSSPLSVQSAKIHIDTDFFVALQELEKVRRRALRLQAIPCESIELHLSSREDSPLSLFLSSPSQPQLPTTTNPSAFLSKRNTDEGRREASPFASSSSQSLLHSTHPTYLHVINTRELADYILQETADLREMAYERLYLWVQGLLRQASGIEEGPHGGLGGEKFLSISRKDQSIKKNGGVPFMSVKNHPGSLREREERMGQSGVSHNKPSSSYSRDHEGRSLHAPLERNDHGRNNEEKERGNEESRRYDAFYEVEKFSSFLSALGGMRKSEIEDMISRVRFISPDGYKSNRKKEDEEKGERKEEKNRVAYADQGLIDSSQTFIQDRKKTSSDSPGKHSEQDEDHLPPLLFRAFLALRDRPPYLVDCIHEFLHLRSMCVYESIFGIRDNDSCVCTSTVGSHLKKKGSFTTNIVPTSQHLHWSHGDPVSSLVNNPLNCFTKSVFRVACRFALKWIEAEDQERVQMRSGKSGSEKCRLIDGEKEEEEGFLLDAKCTDVSHQMNTQRRSTQQDKKAGFAEKERRREYEEEISALPLEVFLRAEPVHFIKQVLERFCRYAAVERSIVQGLLSLCSYSRSLQKQTPTSPPQKKTGDNAGGVQARVLSSVQETDGRVEGMKREQEGGAADTSSPPPIIPSQHQPFGLAGDSSSLPQTAPSLEDLFRNTTAHTLQYRSLTQTNSASPPSSVDRNLSLGPRPIGGIEGKEVYETCLRNDSAGVFLDGNSLLGEILHTSIQHFKLAVEKSFSMMIMNTGRGDAGVLISGMGLGGRHPQQQASVLSQYPSRSQQLHYVLGILLIVRLLDSYAQALHALLLFSPSSFSRSRTPQVYTCDAEGDSESITTTTVSTAGTLATERDRAASLSDNKGWRGSLDGGAGVEDRKEKYEGGEEDKRKESMEGRFRSVPFDASSTSSPASTSAVSLSQGNGLLPSASTTDTRQRYQGMNGGGRGQGERTGDDGRTTRLNEEESSKLKASYPPVLQLVQYCEGLAEKGEEMFLSLWERHLIQATTPTSSSSAEACLSSLILAGHLSAPSHDENAALLNDSTSKNSDHQQRDGLEKHGNLTIGGGSSASRGNAVFFELIEKLQEVLQILCTPLLSRSEEKALVLLATGIASKLELNSVTWSGIASQTHAYRQSKTGRGDHLGLSFAGEDTGNEVWKEELSNLIQMEKMGHPDIGVDKHVNGICMSKDRKGECEVDAGFHGLVRGSILLTNGRRSRITGLRGGQTLRFLAEETPSSRGSHDEKTSQNIESEELHSWVEGSIAPLLNFCRQDALRFHNPAETAVCLVNAYACAQEPLCRYKVCGSYVHLLSELVDQQITKLIEIEAESSLKSLGLFERLQVVRKAVERKSDMLSGKTEATDGWDKSQDRKEVNGDSMQKKGGVSSTTSAVQVSDKDLPESEGGKLLSVEELKKFFREFYMALYSTNALHLGYISRLMHRHLRSRAIIQVSKAVLQAYTEVYVHTVALGLATHTPEEIAVLLDV